MQTLLLYKHTPKRTLAALLILASLVFFGTSFFTAMPAGAQEGQQNNSTVTLTPTKKSYTKDAGSSLRDSVTVINNGSESFNFRVYANPYGVKSEAYDPDFDGTSKSTNAHTWFDFDKTEYELKPRARMDVPYSLNIPDGARPGGHYAVIFIETQKPKGDQGNIARQKRVGALTYLTVNGQFRNGGSILEYKAPLVQLSPPLNTTIRVENTGNNHFDTNVDTVVSDLFGRPKYKHTAAYTVLPGTVRGIKTEWQKSPSYGIFKVNQQVKYLEENRQYDKYVLMFPIWIPVLGVIIMLAGAVFALHRRNML